MSLLFALRLDIAVVWITVSFAAHVAALCGTLPAGLLAPSTAPVPSDTLALLFGLATQAAVAYTLERHLRRRFLQEASGTAALRAQVSRRAALHRAAALHHPPGGARMPGLASSAAALRRLWSRCSDAVARRLI
jgi:hypothetical protein